MNKDIIDNLKILQDYYKKTENQWRVRAYTQAIFAINKYPNKINTRSEAFKIKGIGKSIADKIEEFLKYGKIEKVEEVRKELGEIERKRTSQEQIISSFEKIWGVGPKKAEELYDKGFRSISDLKNRGEKFLTKNQLIGLKYFDDLQESIPREYITVFRGVLRHVLDKEYGKSSYKLKIAGSYRRGKLTSGDIDCLITSKNFDLPSLIDTLKKWNIVTDVLSMRGEKFMGISHCPSGKGPHFRFDIEFVPKEEWWTALVYFTGSKSFNIIMRTNAKKMGFKLDQHGLYKLSGKKIPIKSEEELFKILDMDYLRPLQR